MHAIFDDEDPGPGQYWKPEDLRKSGWPLYWRVEESRWDDKNTDWFPPDYDPAALRFNIAVCLSILLGVVLVMRLGSWKFRRRAVDAERP